MTPEEVIQAFDRVICLVYGPKHKREYEHRHDSKTAQGWIDKGADIFTCMFVFVEAIKFQYESGKEPPKSLAFVDQNIDAAINKENNKQLDEWEKELSRWVARCKGWQKMPHLWDYNNWGSTPDQQNTRVPKMVLTQLGIIKN